MDRRGPLVRVDDQHETEQVHQLRRHIHFSQLILQNRYLCQLRWRIVNESFGQVEVALAEIVLKGRNSPTGKESHELRYAP
jgi:hypothetical protein